MTFDDVKNFLASSNGPGAVLLAVALIFGIPSYPNRWLAAFAPGWFSLVALIVAKHAEFTVAEQCGIILSFFLGFRSFAAGLASPAPISKGERPRT
jgi:hypothetical protein